MKITELSSDTDNDWDAYESNESDNDTDIRDQNTPSESELGVENPPTASIGARIIRTVNLQQNKKFYDVLLVGIFAAIFYALAIMFSLNICRMMRQEEEVLRKENLKKEAMLNHLLEHQNAEIVLVDNSNNFWNATACPDLTIKGYTVTNMDENEKWYSIRTFQGFSTNTTAGDGQLRFKINYAEFMIGSFEGTIYVALASEDFKIKDGQTNTTGSFYFGIANWGHIFHSLSINATDATDRFKSGDTIGIGLLVVQQSATAEAADCARCRQPHLWLFYTKNGEIWGDSIALPAEVPSFIFPTIFFYQAGSVSANFGQKPFAYKIPPAKGLCVGDQCQKLIF